MDNKKSIKKQIIYRSTHRGTKEMDLLLGNFVKKNINKLNNSEIKDLEVLVRTEDETLKNWYFKNNMQELMPINKVTKMFIKFKL